ncbi:nitrogen permease regulator 2, partial [Pleurostoma richardsiae]
MALEAPLRSSTGSSIMSAFSPHQDMSVPQPDSSSLRANFKSSTSSIDSQSLRPNSYPRSHSAHLLMSPTSDIVGPSPVTSNGTETTEIEDEVSEEAGAHPTAANPQVQPQLMMLKTNIAENLRPSLSDEAVSVIHAPESFHQWASSEPQSKPMQPVQKPDDIISPPASEPSGKENLISQPTPPPISTNVKPVRYSLDNATPQAQNLQDVLSDTARLRSSSASSLELIPEIREVETDAEDDGAGEDHFVTPVQQQEESEIRALRTALEECWTLCNTLANLSSIHRERVFNSSGTPDAHEKAWKSCWKLCQRLYHSRDEISEPYTARTNLDLCRDFCQALFDIRPRKDEVADSVLRVSFELNNHLYSAQDNRNLPEAFRERTLDFYITLCHRLMKQRSELAVAEETDKLLGTCWTLAEMLFSLRQNTRDGEAPDEELLGSAVQACWDLCDIFREGWTQVRPDRGTPRPSQVSFFQHSQQASDARSNTGSRASHHSKRESLKSVPEDLTGAGAVQPARRKPAAVIAAPVVPETPVTEFEDTPISPESRSPQMPNILVLGPEGSQSGSRGGRWSSSASNLSSYSQSSAKTSSTATTTTAEDVNITRIKVLIVKAAMNIGFSREAA